MANNKLSDSENILVKVDQNNLIYIDPNSVIDDDGFIQPRNVKQENLVMYANLEADLIPRSILKSYNDSDTLVSVAKGTLNFLRNQKGEDYDTNWTESYFPQKVDVEIPFGNSSQTQKFSVVKDNFDETGQSFGIDSINVSIKTAQAIPTVTINFIDVRGKTLFESPENSPYKAFFHLPWPIFYLTLKGYYGKAIRYRLHLTKMSTRFSESTGNFETTANFIGSTSAFLKDIQLEMIKNAPYMFYFENTKDEKTDGDNTTIKISSSSRGYQVLKSVYSEYKRKGLIDNDFPVKTLRELIKIAESLDKILEQQILNNKLTPDVFQGINEFEKNLQYFEDACIKWAQKYLLNRNNVKDEFGNECYQLSIQEKTSDDVIVGQKNSLRLIVENNSKKLKESHLFSQKMVDLTKDTKTGNSNFTIGNILSKPIIWSDKYYRKNPSTNFYEVKFDLLINDIREIRKVFDNENKKLIKFVEEEMNKIILNGELGFGFKPTIKNIFAVILANADVYIRLMKETHLKAFNIANERAEIILENNLSKETAFDKPIYPWPEIKKSSENDKQNVIAYPGDSDLISKLQSDDSRLWPEVDFVENYIKIATNKVDPNADKESVIDGVAFVLPNDDNKNNSQPINALSLVTDTIPYIDKSLSSILYEIWERATYFTLVDTFNLKSLEEIAELDFNNLKKSIENDNEIIALLKDNVTSENKLKELLKSFSFFERYPYYLDQLPTVPYIKDSLNIPFRIIEYKLNKDATTTKGYDNLKSNINNYIPESYRKNIYPFNSETYLSYLNQTTYNDDELKFSFEFEIDPSDSLIQTQKNISFYVKSGYTKNLFDNKLKIGNTNVSIFNTTYFHRQLYYDFINQKSYGKYASSAYLLLNSLPFKDLEDVVLTNNTKVKMSALFREIGATHFIPYHLICKWGSIYHRYKTYLSNGTDILNNILDVNNKTRPIDGNLFFNNNQTSINFTSYTANNENITYTDNVDVGVHPFYDAIYHQIINGYNHYDVLSGNTSFSQNVTDKKILTRSRKQSNNLKFWTSLVDNSKYIINDERYTLLPCDGGNENINIVENLTTGELLDLQDTFNTGTQKNFRVFWSDEYTNDEYDKQLFPKYNEYHSTYVSGITRSTMDKLYSIGNDYRKIIDLIGTFSPLKLEEFEDIFLQFASEKINDDSVEYRFPSFKYTKFQDLLKEIGSVNKDTSDPSNIDDLISTIKTKQTNKLLDISKNIISDTNYVKLTLGNPKELDLHLLYGFLDLSTENTFSYESYNQSQLTNNNINLINLYIGEDIDNYYRNFFIVNDVELNEQNILQFRTLARIYAGYIKEGNPNTFNDFRTYLINNIFNSNSGSNFVDYESRRTNYLTFLIGKFKSLNQVTETNIINKITPGYNTKDVKLELYNTFKSFNDKWIGGNSIGQRLLLEEFLFLDKANKDIGDKFYLNIDRLLALNNPYNSEIDLYGLINLIINRTGLDMRPLPAYINFYGNNTKNKNKITPSKNLSSNLFGTFLEVDYQESTPKIIIQLIGQTSKHPDVQNKNYKFADDSFDMGSTNNNPLIITSLRSFEGLDLSKSNRVVGFEVSFGDQNQSIFKGITLDQATIKNTSESLRILENIARTEGGAGAHNVDVGLFDYYKQASYTCEVTCMGNVMIQPTMFFYLKNVPMFKGSYMILDVTHNIKNGSFITTFRGARIPNKSLPDPNDSFTSSYRVLFDRIKEKAIAKFRNNTNKLVSPVTITYNGKNYITDYVQNAKNENFEKIKISKAGITEFGIPYNGFEYPIAGGTESEKYIQLVNYEKTSLNKKEFLRARVVLMNGSKYKIEDNRKMEIATIKRGTPLEWKNVKNLTEKDNCYFFTTKFLLSKDVTADKITSAKTYFVNPTDNKQVEVSYQVTNDIISGPIDNGFNLDLYGIGMSQSLMSKLGLYDGDVVYFVMY